MTFEKCFSNLKDSLLRKLVLAIKDSFLMYSAWQCLYIEYRGIRQQIQEEGRCKYEEQRSIYRKYSKEKDDSKEFAELLKRVLGFVTGFVTCIENEKKVG